MIYRTPPLTIQIRRDLDELDGMRARLVGPERVPPWLGTLRRQARIAAVESSVSIEGYVVPERAAVGIVEDADRIDPTDDDRAAVACYGRGMDHVGVLATDPGFEWNERVILDLHFDVCSFQRDKSPGRWRTEPISVTAPRGGIAYRAPDADDVVPLMAEVVEWLERGSRAEHVVVRAAMAHLHLVSVHPFWDGNGRLARIVQSLVLAREGLVLPELGSIEEYLAAHTSEYYAVLQEVQGGRYQPRRSAIEWVRFCIEAHLAQARDRLRLLAAAGTRWRHLELLVEERGWPDRLVIALEQSLVGGADRQSYEHEADVSPATASNDFRRLRDAGLVVQRGKGPSVRYEAAPILAEQVAAAVGTAALEASGRG